MASPSLSVMANPRAGVRRCQPGAESSLGSGADPAGKGGGAAGPDDVLEKQYWSQVQGGSWRGWQCGVGASRWGVGPPLRVGQGTVDPAVSRSTPFCISVTGATAGLQETEYGSAHTHHGLCSHPHWALLTPTAGLQWGTQPQGYKEMPHPRGQILGDNTM